MTNKPCRAGFHSIFQHGVSGQSIGFGDSSKPKDYNYSTFERADLVEKIWAQLGIESTSVVAHDFGSTVLLELLYRDKNNLLSAKIENAVLLNGGLYTDLHRPD